MASLISTASRQDQDDEPRGGPIGALVIAVPVSLLLWGLVAFVLLQVVH